MKIGMMCLWNAANGPSIHAELVGKAWVELGHKLRVFSALKHPDARPTLQKDEDFVSRHFRVNEVIPFTRAASFDPSPLLNEEYEVFVAQNVERLPADKLLEAFPEIKKKLSLFKLFMRARPLKIPFTTSLTGMLLFVLIRDIRTAWSNHFLLKRFI